MGLAKEMNTNMPDPDAFIRYLLRHDKCAADALCPVASLTHRLGAKRKTLGRKRSGGDRGICTYDVESDSVLAVCGR